MQMAHAASSRELKWKTTAHETKSKKEKKKMKSFESHKILNKWVAHVDSQPFPQWHLLSVLALQSCCIWKTTPTQFCNPASCSSVSEFTKTKKNRKNGSKPWINCAFIYFLLQEKVQRNAMMFYERERERERKR
jgi:hypothetical protein